MKKGFFLLILAMVTLSTSAQNVIENKGHSSVFANFDELGIKKELFVKKFRDPLSKDMCYDENGNKIEKLYYKENLKKEDVVIITTFTFKNSELVEQKSLIESFMMDKKMLEKISNDLTSIRNGIRLK